jgi:molybdenum cofactor cytidylyltransferase
MAIAAERVTAVLLAAGRGERFGGDKLAFPFSAHIAVIGPSALDLAALGFDCRKAPPGAAMSASLKLGFAAAAQAGCDACLVALADMPLVPATHIAALLAAHDGPLTATLSDGMRMVPALIARSASYRSSPSSVPIRSTST